MLSQTLINLAREDVANASPNDPDAHHLRDAQRRAYYALFHALSETAAETFNLSNIPALSGGRPTFTHDEIIARFHERIYRMFDHSVFNARPSNEFRATFSAPIFQFMSVASSLKTKREDADYSPFPTQTPNDVSREVENAAKAIIAFKNVPLSERAALIAYLKGRKL